jgi:beta-mannosidase
MGHAGAPYYFLKRTYDPIHACAVLPHLVWAPGETMPLTGCVLALTSGAAAAPVENESTMLSLRVYGRELREIASRESRVPLLDAPAVYTVPAGELVIPDDVIDSFLFVVTELHTVDGELLARSVLWPRCLSHMENPDYRADYRGSPKPAIEHTEGPWLKDQIAATTAALTIGEMTSEDDSAGEETTIMVTMKNSGPAPAFPVHLDVAGRKRAFYASDNFFWLEPGESRRVALQVRWRDAAETTPRVRAAAWNAPAVEAALR